MSLAQFDYIYQWTDERSEDETRDREFLVEFSVNDWGYRGDRIDPPCGPEIEIGEIKEIISEDLVAVDAELGKLLEGDKYLHEQLVEYAQDNRRSRR